MSLTKTTDSEESQLAHDLMRTLGIPFRTCKETPWVGGGQGGMWWTGKLLMVPAARPRLEDYLHEIAHWIQAPDEWKSRVNYGLDGAFLRKKEMRFSGDRAKQRSERWAHQEEKRTCLLTFFLLDRIGDRDRAIGDMRECDFDDEPDKLVQKGRWIARKHPALWSWLEIHHFV